MSLDYLQVLHETYEHWLLQSKPPAPVLVIDANREQDQVRQLYIKYQSYILGHIGMSSDVITQEPFEETRIV
jgi:hypothetical protein